MKTVLLKKPGLGAEEKQISTEHDKIKAVIGCDYQTLRFQPYEHIYIISAQRETAIGLALPHNIWRPLDSPLYGNVIAIRKNEESGRFENLLPDDISRLSLYLAEHSFTNVAPDALPANNAIADRDARKAYHREHAVLAKDDLNVVLRRHAELESILYDKLIGALRDQPALNGIEPRLTYHQMVALLQGLGVLSPRLCILLKRMGTIRNKFAHDPGYTVSVQEAHWLREQAFGLEDDDSSIPLIQELCYEHGLEITEESAVLRALYTEVFGWLHQNTELDGTA